MIAPAQIVVGNLVAVLRGNYHGIDANRVVHLYIQYLLGIFPSGRRKSTFFALANFRKLMRELMRQLDRP